MRAVIVLLLSKYDIITVIIQCVSVSIQSNNTVEYVNHWISDDRCGENTAVTVKSPYLQTLLNGQVRRVLGVRDWPTEYVDTPTVSLIGDRD